MPRPHKDKSWYNHKSNDLFLAIISLKSVDEVARFMRDIATTEEIRALSERWQAAKLIHKGEDYRTIAQKLKISPTTVSRVAHWLNYGTNGYKIAIKRRNLKK